MTGIEVEGSWVDGSGEMPRVTPAWLTLREPADAAARAEDLVELVRRRLPGRPPYVIYDLGSGTGSMARWLAPRLPGPQHWVMLDRDGDLLDEAVATVPELAGDGSPITVESRRCHLDQLSPADLAGASLVTTSALLDILTAAEVESVADVCAELRAPVLWTLSVTGRVELSPPDPWDAQIGDAFNAHQRRMTGHGRLLGPDAPDIATNVFARRGARVRVRSSPWKLAGAGSAELMTEWFVGWLGAACELRPELAGPTGDYGRRRLAEAEAGRLAVTVDHRDLLATWD